MAFCVLDNRLGGGITTGDHVDGPCSCGHKTECMIGIKLCDYSWWVCSRLHVETDKLHSSECYLRNICRLLWK